MNIVIIKKRSNKNDGSCIIYREDGEKIYPCHIALQTNFKRYDIVDIDGEQNCEPILYSNQELQDDVDIIYVDLDKEFRISNDRGEYLEWKDAQLTGNMEIISEVDIANGSEEAATLGLMLKKSNDLQIKYLSDDTLANLSILGYDGVISYDKIASEHAINSVVTN